MQLQVATKVVDLSQPKVMGILNCTPDSFSDGGNYQDLEKALRHALRMVGEGAAIIDIGGESTRPGASGVSVQQELDRVMPLIERLAAESDVPICIDTSKPEVMRAAVEAGAVMINDVYALRRPGAMEAARACAVPVCLMHMRGDPRTMQQAPEYQNVTAEVRQFLEERIRACETAGIPGERIVIDPGFGFGKKLVHNLKLLRELHELTSLGAPLLVGISRKSMIGTLLDNAPVTARLHGGIAAAVIAVLHGARLVRTHDVLPTVEALKIAAAVHGPEC